MIYKSLLSAIILLTFSFSAQSQTWHKDYYKTQPPGTPLCYGYSVAYGGLICMSTADSFFSFNEFASDYYLVRLNKFGDTIWSKRNWLDTFSCRSIINAITQLSNGDYVIASTLYSYDSLYSNTFFHGYTCSIFYRLDSNGNILNVIRRVMDVDDGQDINVLKAENNGYYIVYSCDSFYNSSITSLDALAQSIIEKHDSNDVLLWSYNFSGTYNVVGSGTSSALLDAYPGIQIHSSSTVDNGVAFITRNNIGKLNADGSLAYSTSLTSLFPTYDYNYYMFCTSDTSTIVLISDAVGHLCKFNSSGAVTHQIDLHDSLSFGNGTETSNGKYLIWNGYVSGFYLLAPDFTLLDSIRYPFTENMYGTAALIPNPYGGAFCAYPMGLDTTHIYAINFDSLFNRYHDLKISMHSSCLVPGFTSHLHVGFFNNGVDTINTTAVVVIDSNTTFLSSVPAPILVSEDTLTYSIVSLPAGITDSLLININVDSTLGMGVILTFNSNSPYVNNIGSADDSITYCGTTISSLDPNFKSVNRPYYFTSDKSMIYTIGFENTGTYFASRIVVNDTLDPHLDPSTLKIISGSPVSPSLRWPAPNVAQFYYNDINLPDSISDPLNSYGQILFSIITKADAALGDVIKNTAYIYFDYNQPVATNTTINVISTADASLPTKTYYQNFSLFPNPSTGAITLDLPGKSVNWNISVSDISGKQVTNTTINDNQATLHLQLPQGVYMIKATNLDNHSTIIRKMVIER